MSIRNFANHAPQQTLAGSITNSATSLTISGSFAGWPAAPFFAEIDRGTASAEIVSVTNITGLTATVVRAQDGDAAISHAAGATIDFVVIAQDFREANAHVNATTNVHGVSGHVVGDSDAQTLTNKTLVDPIVNGTLTMAADGKVDGVIVLKQYANEAAATAALTPIAGTLVWLTAPTGAGTVAGIFRYDGTSWKRMVASGDLGFIGEAASTTENITLSTTAAVAAHAVSAVTFTLTRQTRVRIETQVRYNPAAAVANTRYQTQAGYNPGNSQAFGSFVGLGKVFDIANQSIQQSSAFPAATVLLAAGTYTAYASVRRINNGSATDLADAFYTVVTAIGNV